VQGLTLTGPGYRVARVRTIFRLPDEFNYAHPLAYVEWYSTFCRPAPGVDMYPVSMVTAKSRASVVRVDSIRRSCHLIPYFGMKANPTLSAGDLDALDRCTRFYVSDFLDLYTYQFFND
jgi:hypothetical protein